MLGELEPNNGERSDEVVQITEVAKVKSRKEKMAERKLLYCAVEPHLEIQRKILKDVYIEEKDEELKQELLQSILYSILEESENPLLDMISLYEVLPDKRSGSENSLAGIILKNFFNWLKKNDIEIIKANFLSIDVQKRALSVFAKDHTTFLKELNEVYGFKKDDGTNNAIVVEHIKELASSGKFKEALDVSLHFDLFSKYDIYDFIIPCFLQDKGQIALDALNNATGVDHLKKKLVKFFDNLLYLSDEDIELALKPYKDQRIMTLPFDRFQGKTLDKLVSRIQTDLGLDIKYAPNLAKERFLGGIRFNVYNRYKGTMGDNAYFDTIKGSLDKQPDLLLNVISYLTKENHYDDALRWVVVYKVSPEDLPISLRNYLNDSPERMDEAQKIVDKFVDYQFFYIFFNFRYLYPTDVRDAMLFEDSYPIYMVDTWEDLEILIEKIQAESIIGLDSETRPPYMGPNPVALLQIAFEEESFLVDIYRLEGILRVEQWEEFYLALFAGPAIKLGFDFLNDMRSIFAASYLSSIVYIIEESNVICLKRLVESILQVDNGFVDFSLSPRLNESSQIDDEIGNLDIHFGLSDLSYMVCGRRLDKEEQCGNWAQRPLRIEQKKYAAMDAFIVREIFKKLHEKASSRDIDISDHVQDAIINSLKREKVKKQKVTKVEDMLWSECVEALNSKVIGDVTNPKQPHELKCIVDLMLSGLGKNLRRIGVDVIIGLNKKHFKKECSTRNDRVIFTAGKAYEALRIAFPGRVLCIQNVACNPMDQLKMIVEKYHLVFDKTKVFSRCMECNSSYFVRVPGIVVHALYNCHVVCTNVFNEDPFNVTDWFNKLHRASLRKNEPIPFRVVQDAETPEWLVVNVEDGVIHITKNIIQHRQKDSGIASAIEKLHDNVIQQKDRFFYICSDCGKYYWDGLQRKNFEETVEKALSENLSTLEV